MWEIVNEKIMGTVTNVAKKKVRMYLERKELKAKKLKALEEKELRAAVEDATVKAMKVRVHLEKEEISAVVDATLKAIKEMKEVLGVLEEDSVSEEVRMAVRWEIRKHMKVWVEQLKV